MFNRSVFFLSCLVHFIYMKNKYFDKSNKCNFAFLGNNYRPTDQQKDMMNHGSEEL